MTGCIFDFDGVICDTEKYHFAAWREIALELGVGFSYEEYLPFQSRGRAVVISYLCAKAGKPLTENLLEVFSKEKGMKFAELSKSVGKNDLIAGADVFIELLYKNCVPLAVASSSSSAGVLLSRLGLAEYFSAIVDGRENLPKKPDPAVFLRAAELLGIPCGQCLVFEDSPSGIAAAETGGFRVVGVGENVKYRRIKTIKDFSGVSLDILS
jgi:HAD superfamily hydrolase (TIGR01509 family)